MSTKKEKCNNNNNSSNIQLFYYEGLSVRTLNFDGEIWFVAKDVADILGFRDAPNATRYLDDDEKALFNTKENTLSIWQDNQEAGISTLDWSSIQEDEEKRTSKRGNPNIIIITEPGPYELVFRSNKPDAKAFSRWVRHDVLPSIRKTGQFSLMNECLDDDRIQKRMFISQEKEAIKFRVAFWNNMLKALNAIDNAILSNQPIPVSGIPKGLNKDAADIWFIKKMRMFIKENIEQKIHSLDVELNALNTLAGLN